MAWIRVIDRLNGRGRSARLHAALLRELIEADAGVEYGHIVMVINPAKIPAQLRSNIPIDAEHVIAARV